jgi:hypothetical protein
MKPLAILFLCLALGCRGPTPSAALQSHPPIAVSIFEVRPVSANATSTRRLSYRFEFEVLRTIEDGAGLGAAGGLLHGESIGISTYSGADLQSGQDAASRLLELLNAVSGEPDPSDFVHHPFGLGNIGQLQLTILRRPAAENLWILERADGRRETIAYGRSRP